MAEKHNQNKPELGRMSAFAVAARWRGAFGGDRTWAGLVHLARWAEGLGTEHTLEDAFWFLTQDNHHGLADIYPVMEKGAEKYGWNNWRSGDGLLYTELVSACLRHYEACIKARNRYAKDPEFGLEHRFHAQCSVQFLLAYEEYGIGIDDRWIRDATDRNAKCKWPGGKE